MKIAVIVFWFLLLASCNNHSSNTKTSDSVNINTTETNNADGGPNNGLGDTNTIGRSNDTLTRDTSVKK